MKRQFNFGPVYFKMLKVIDSCVTFSQLIVAKKYVDVGHEFIKKQIQKDGYLEHPVDLEDALRVREEMYQRILDKSNELKKEVK